MVTPGDNFGSAGSVKSSSTMRWSAVASLSTEALPWRRSSRRMMPHTRDEIRVAGLAGEGPQSLSTPGLRGQEP